MKYLFVVVIFLGAKVWGQVPTPLEVVKAQLDAYNAHDSWAFAELFSENAVIYSNIFDTQPSIVGRDAIRDTYHTLFETFPDNHSEVTERMVQGNFVIDHEHITGRKNPFTMVAVYEVVDGYIVRCWFIR